MLDKKQIWVTFLFKFKMCWKTVKKTRNINNAFGPGAANEQGGWSCFRSFAKETRAMSSIVAGHQKLPATNSEQSSK